MRLGPAIALLAVVLPVLGGCVTERREPARGVRVTPGGAATGGPAPVMPREGEPIARPARGVTTSAAVGVTFVPLGVVAYDGQTLPIMSPDGRFLAAQQGEAPQWAAILGEDGAVPPVRSSIGVYQISGTSARPLAQASALPAGAVLGRSADALGFLIELPREDGSRWIGHANWLTGQVSWLAAGERVSAHGVLAADGALLFTRREPGGPGRIVRRAPGGAESELTAPEGSYFAPIAADDPGVVYALRLVGGGLAIDVLRVRRDVLERTPVSRLLHPSDDALLAHQVMLSVPAPTARAPGTSTRADDTLALLNPARARMSVWDGVSGSLESLAPGTIAAVRSPDPSSPGYFCTTARELVFVPKVGTGGPTGAPVVIIGTPYVPRAARGETPHLVLIGPSRSDPDRLEIVRMILSAPDERP